MHLKTYHFYEDIADDVKKRFYTSNYRLIDLCLEEKIKNLLLL